MFTRILAVAIALWCVFPAMAADPPPRGMPFETYIRLELGMTEGELVLRAGKPDHQSWDNVREGLKSFYYFPTLANPFITTISLRAGRIVNIERTRKTL